MRAFKFSHWSLHSRKTHHKNVPMSTSRHMSTTSQTKKTNADTYRAANRQNITIRNSWLSSQSILTTSPDPTQKTVQRSPNMQRQGRTSTKKSKRSAGSQPKSRSDHSRSRNDLVNKTCFCADTTDNVSTTIHDKVESNFAQEKNQGGLSELVLEPCKFRLLHL